MRCRSDETIHDRMSPILWLTQTNSVNYESPTLTIIIPVYKLSGHRLRNFKFVLRNITAVGCDTIVCEQESEVSVSEYTASYNARYINTHIKDTDVIHKSSLINYAVSCSTSDYIWILDADFYANYSAIVSYMESNECELVRPFESVIFLDNTESETLVTQAQVIVEGSYKANNQTGKFSFLVDRNLFLSVGGMDERYVGWGFQDLDFVENKLPHDVATAVVKQTGYHLYHERPPQTYADTNYRLYSNTRTNQLHQPTPPTTTEYVGRNFA